MTTAHKFLYDEIVKLPPEKVSKALSFVLYLAQEPDDIDKRLLDLISKSGIPTVELETDINGNLLIDPNLHPDIYDWAVNG